MKKHMVCWICMAVLLCGCLQPVSARAISPVEVDRLCSLTLDYSQGETAFAGLEIRAYRVADIFEDGTYALCGDFAGYPMNIYGITSQAEWQQITSTLVAYIAADGLQPDATALTDESGRAQFTQLKAGMYLILSVRAENDAGTWVFEDFMLSVPNPDESGEYCYDVTAKPKCSHFAPTEKPVEYRVVKHWKDVGYAEYRPESVQVDIYKDGVLQFSQSLSAENNWSYSWTAQDDGSVWTAVEREVPEEYTVTVATEGSTLIITNVRQTEPTPPSETGDMMVLWPVLMVCSLCGMLLLLVGLRRMRAEDENA